MNTLQFYSENIPSQVLIDITSLCINAQNEPDKPASANMRVDDWQNHSNSLLYVLQKTDRFKENNGLFTCLYDKELLVAISGCYRSEFDNNIIIGGVRAWVIPGYRAKHLQSLYLLTAQRDWSIAQNANAFALSFNDYNLKLMQIITRTSRYKNKARKGVGHTRPEFFDRFTVLPQQVMIQHTPQWVCFEKLGGNDIDWPFIN